MLGVGIDNFRKVGTGQVLGTKVGTYSHSNYIEILVSTGFIGFLLYFAIYISIFKRIIRLRQRKLKGTEHNYLILVLSMFSMFVLYDFAMVSYYEKMSWLLLSVILAALIIVDKNQVHTDRDKNESPDDLIAGNETVSRGVGLRR